jgi:hypothetical protein
VDLQAADEHLGLRRPHVGVRSEISGAARPLLPEGTNLHLAPRL